MTITKLDITREHCPMTFVKTKLHLENINKGDILEVLLKSGEPLDNVPRTAEEQGYIIVSKEHIKNDIYKIAIQK